MAIDYRLILCAPLTSDGGTLSGGSWRGTTPLTNLQDPVMQKKARSLDATTGSTTFDVVLTGIEPIRVIALIGHNLSLDATWQVRAYSDAGFTTLVYDSGSLDAYPPVYTSLDLEWEDAEFWDGKPSLEDLEHLPLTSIHITDDLEAWQYWRISISDTTNADGYVDMQRFILSEGLIPPYNYGYGATLEYVDESNSETNLGVAEYIDEKDLYRVFKFKLNRYTMEQAHTQVMDLVAKVGSKKQVFVVGDPTDSINLQRRSFLGRLRRLSPLEYDSFDNAASSFEIKESV